MKTTRLIVGFAAGIVLCVICLAGCGHLGDRRPPSGLNVGAAEVDITPPVGYRMAGYFDERLSTGVHDPLKAKVIVMQQGREQLALVFCDLLGVPLEVTSRARALASRQTRIPVAHIMICGTHSHTGPLFDDVRRKHFHEAALAKLGSDPHEKIDYAAFLTDQLAKAIANAQKTLRPAELMAGAAKQPGLTFNRRFLMKDGKVVFNPGALNPNIVRAAGPVDEDVGMLLARDAKTKELFAGATVFAMHADTTGGTEFSADYPYYLEQTLRRAFGQEFISAFGAGTCGDLNHIDVTTKDRPKPDFLGGTLGQAVAKASENLPLLQRPALAARHTIFEAPLQPVTMEQLADAQSKLERLGDPKLDFMAKVITAKTLDLAGRGPTLPMEVQVFRLDQRTGIVCLPGEIFVELGLAIKQASPFANTIVMSICNDRPNYVPTEKAFGEGSYEVTNSRVKPGTGERLVREAVKLLSELKDVAATD